MIVRDFSSNSTLQWGAWPFHLHKRNVLPPQGTMSWYPQVGWIPHGHGQVSRC
jgi:hypothetical protein